MNSYSERLHHVIPGGAHTYSRGDDQFPSNAPQILDRGHGAYVWDADGNRFLDYGMALRAVTLGYAHERVNRAAMREMDKGINLTRPSLTELRAAELLREVVPSAQMVKFGKNGSNVTTAAVKLARACTGRRYVCIPRQHPFFSFDDWFIGTTALKRGIPPEHYSTTLLFDYSNIVSLEKLFAQHPGEIAAVMLEPATTITPCPPGCGRELSCESPCAACPNGAHGFLHQVQTLCRKQGALFILDEMITGFRWHLGGAQAFFGVEPDLCTFGKGMANGFAVAAVAGKREFMSAGAIQPQNMERTFLLSTTHGAEMTGLGAFIEAIAIYREQHVVEHLWRYGALLRDGLRSVAARHGLQKHFLLDGPAINLNYVTCDTAGTPSLPFRTLFAQELIKHKVLMPWIAVSLAHNDAELNLTLDAADRALKVYAQALESGIERFLQGPAIKPVFRPRN
ncbi:MAG: glutamate-1-semialdehyde 2,1-aminomutase [Pseudomonadota bacterium]